MGEKDGVNVGLQEGSDVGVEGAMVGEEVGFLEGLTVGVDVDCVGRKLGEVVGNFDGDVVGSAEVKTNQVANRDTKLFITLF